MATEMKPLTSELVDDFLYFFDHIAFADNPDWAGCYCYFYHVPKADWEKSTKEGNREGAKQLILAGAMHGYLAYADGQPVGWCNANDKSSYRRLLDDKELWDSEGNKVGAIVCFIIAPDQRKKGIARQLLQGVCSGFESQGYDYAEAYPRKGELSAAEQYHGPLSLYLEEGFSIHKGFESYSIVRKRLNVGRNK